MEVSMMMMMILINTYEGGDDDGENDYNCDDVGIKTIFLHSKDRTSSVFYISDADGEDFSQ